MEVFTKVICEGFVSKLRLNTPMIEYRKNIEEDTCIKEALLDPNRKVAKVSRKSPISNPVMKALRFRTGM